MSERQQLICSIAKVSKTLAYHQIKIRQHKAYMTWFVHQHALLIGLTLVPLVFLTFKVKRVFKISMWMQQLGQILLLQGIGLVKHQLFKVFL